jgi:thiamine-phosphate pyrophosphorylase
MGTDRSGADRRALLAGARLYVIAGADDLGRLLPGILEAGADLVQLRDKDADDGRLTEAAATAQLACLEHGALLIVNDRPDLAAAVGADGVHVGQDDIDPAEARRIVGPEALIGSSTHSPAQMAAAEASAADYLGVGPVNATPTKPGRPAVGLELVRDAARLAAKPFFAIGGIEPSGIPAVLDAGATRVAVVRAVTQADDPVAAVRELTGLLEGGRRGAIVEAT